MSRSAPTDAQLLDMAREVLAVCQDRSLRDIIEDLSITHSSEQTINRIFDGQFLKALVAEATAAPSQDVVILLSSSEDDASDRESMSGRREATAHVESSVSKRFNRSSPTPPCTMSATRALLFMDEDVLSKRQGTLEIEHLQLNLDNGEQKEASLKKRRLSLVSADEPLPQGFQCRTTQDDEPLVIDVLHTPKQRPRTTAATFQIVSPVGNDAFPDWDYDLIPSPSRGNRGSPTIVFSPPSKHSRNTLRTSENRRNSSIGTSRLASSPPGTLPGTLPGTPPRTITSPALSDEQSIKPVISQVHTRSSSHVGSFHSSRERTPSPRDLEPQTFIDLDEGPDPDWSSNRWKGDNGASDVEDREYLEKKAHWDALANASLSPPSLFQDDFESDQELLDDVFGSLPTGKKRGLSRSGSSKSLVAGRKGAQGKAASLVEPPELDDWSGDTPSGSALSVEQEIERRNRRKKAKKQDAASGDSDSADVSSISTTRRKRSAKEPQNADKEAKMLAKEEQKRAMEEKKKARDWEKEHRQILKQRAKWEKEDERRAERDATRQIRIANRLTTKSESAKEMIVCIEESLHQSMFGQIMQDYLSSIECQVNVLRVAGSEGASASQGDQFGRFNRRRTDELCPARNTLFWRRTVNSLYDEEQDVFSPIAEEEIQLESFLLLYQTAEDFVRAFEQKQFLGLLSQLKRDLRLRKNKERLANAGKSSGAATLLKEDPRQRQRIILLIAGMDDYFRGLRKVATTRYRQIVLEKIQSNATEGRSPTLPTQEEGSTVSRTFIERELLRLQLEHDCLIIHSCDEEDSAQVITSLTEQIGLARYVGTRKSELSICTEGVKSGTDQEDTWIKTLQAIHMVTHGVARSIVAEYPTIKSLYDGYRQCANTGEAQSMLEGIPIINRNNVLGKTLSRRIYDIFMSEDPAQAVS